MVKLSVWLFQKATAFARHKVAVCLLAAAIPMVIRVAALRFVPMPHPYVHDEFSYLLGADTLASGRLTNPPHPMWVHFETFHENFQPTYQSKYPPGPAWFMALGQKFLHHPWFGVCLSFGIMCACICWMLQGWVPSVYALLGSLIAIGQLGIFGYWMDSYWGGAVPAIGGSLVLGAVPRLVKRSSASASLLGALGVMILANSRPYEGLALTIGAAVGLLWWQHRSGRGWLDLLKPRVLVPGFLVCVAGLAWTAYYNYRGTGDPFLMPYVLNSRQYAASPAFYLVPTPPEPVYRHAVIRDFWINFEKAYYLKMRSNPLRLAESVMVIVPFYASTLLFLPIAAGLVGFARSQKMRVVIIALAVLWAALLLEKSWLPHYFAPGVGLLLLPALFSLRWLRVRLRAAGSAVVLAFVACSFGHGLAMAYFAHNEGTSTPQQQATEKILAAGKPGERHLVIVRYSPQHSPHIEYVFNRANIDSSQIVWARDMGEAKNKELLDYYPDRRVWLLRPDAPPLSLIPYASAPQ
jgi:hypothetical protein